MVTFTRWSTPAQLSLRSTESSPAIANNGGRLCMAWRNTSDKIMVSISDNDGLSWSPGTKPRVGGEETDFMTQNGPALAAGDGKFVMAWTDNSDKIQVYRSTDGFDWSPVAPSIEETAPNPLALAVAVGQKKIVIGYCKAPNGNNCKVMYKLFLDLGSPDDTSDWEEGDLSSFVNEVKYLALTAGKLDGLQNKFMMAWTDQADQIKISESTDGETWSAVSGAPSNAVTSVAPAMTYSNRGDEHVWCIAWKDANDNIKVLHSKDGRTSWNDALPPIDISTQNGPGLSPAGARLYMIWRGSPDDNYIWASYARINIMTTT